MVGGWLREWALPGRFQAAKITDAKPYMVWFGRRDSELNDPVTRLPGLPIRHILSQKRCQQNIDFQRLRRRAVLNPRSFGSIH